METKIQESTFCHIEDNKNFKCGICETVVDTQILLSKHMKKSHLNCNTCGTEFASEMTLAKHMRASHEQIQGHKCNSCDQYFKRHSSLKQHKKNCTFKPCAIRM